jgi:DNA-binding CsgD family transcriptional regulator
VPFGSLTRREREILARLADGRTDREIAEELGITAKTASVHVGNLKAKMGVATRVEAVLFARDRLGSEER